MFWPHTQKHSGHGARRTSQSSRRASFPRAASAARFRVTQPRPPGDVLSWLVERELHAIRLGEYGNSGFKKHNKELSAFCLSVRVELEDSSCIRINMKRILYPIMALCYNNGMLSPPNLARCPLDHANDYPQLRTV